MDFEQRKYKTVCEAPSGNGFTVEHMPDFLLQTDFDNSQPHVHSFYEILWFQQGTGKHTVDFIEYDVKPNTIFFLSPGQVHHFDHSTDYRGVSLKMCSDFLNTFDSSRPCQDSKYGSMNDGGIENMFMKYNVFHSFDTPPFYTIDSDVASELALIVDKMEDESLKYREFGNIDILQSLLRIFLVKIQRHGIQDGELHLDTLKPSHLLFVRFRRLVEKEFTNMHTVQEYADRLNVAVRTLNKCVNECSSMSPLAYINNRILLEAKRMVRYTDLMIKEIASDLGFEDPSYFVKFFKRTTGYLPNEFREQDEVQHCVS